MILNEIIALGLYWLVVSMLFIFI
uniref:Uncharacterized protein n=1 Tax=Rhizophora mucronata TaxID=61149 RepID=A0A2P2QG89_RHIMU